MFSFSNKHREAAIVYLETEIRRHNERHFSGGDDSGRSEPVYSVQHLMANVDFAVRIGLISEMEAAPYRVNLKELSVSS